MAEAMRLNEQRKEALLENAHRLHSGKGLQTPQFKPKGSSWPFVLALVAVAAGLGLVFYGG